MILRHRQREGEGVRVRFTQTIEQCSLGLAGPAFANPVMAGLDPAIQGPALEHCSASRHLPRNTSFSHFPLAA